MATARDGKPYIWVTSLAKLLGGQQCVWKAWFAAHFKYDKFEEDAFDLVRWNRDHTRLMQARVQELEADGWTVQTEEQNAFKLEGQVGIVAGKPDIVATKPGQVLVVDGKTGKQRDADIFQVLLYLFAIPKSRPDLASLPLEGEVEYKNGERIVLTPDQLSPERMDDIVSLIKVVAGPTPPKKVPSRDECRRCNVGPTDCPERVGARQERTTLVGEF